MEVSGYDFETNESKTITVNSATVKELIEFLQKIPQDFEVCFNLAGEEFALYLGDIYIDEDRKLIII